MFLCRTWNNFKNDSQKKRSNSRIPIKKTIPAAKTINAKRSLEEREEKENDIILETGLLEGRGNYQGGSKEKETIFPSLLKEKQKIIKKAKKFLNNEKDILNNLDEDTDITDE